MPQALYGAIYSIFTKKPSMKLANPTSKITVKTLGRCDYGTIHTQMLQHIDQKRPSEIWYLEHNPVYTRGRLSLEEHIRYRNNIPIIDTDRGGQVTYHGPGQMIVYPLIYLEDFKISPTGLVSLLEDTTLETLSHFNLKAYADPKARGVYIQDQKIASIGLKIRDGYAYHGIAINIDLDLSPFEAIVPCGNADMIITKLSDHTDKRGFETAWLQLFVEKLDTNRYNKSR